MLINVGVLFTMSVEGKKINAISIGNCIKYTAINASIKLTIRWTLNEHHEEYDMSLYFLFKAFFITVQFNLLLLAMSSS